MDTPFDTANLNESIPFEENDPYNPQNRLRGLVNRRQGNNYGDLWITHINGEPCSQHIYSSPKMHYPFDKNSNWNFPSYDHIELYEKLDGTCIISYTYQDSAESHFQTYKTRLRPFLGQSKFGNFYEMWNEMLLKYPGISQMCESPTHNYIFELYGKRNKILIDYDTPLDTKLIFARQTSNGLIVPPSAIAPKNVPVLGCLGVIEEITPEKYDEIKADLERKLAVGDGVICGMEGMVMYFIEADAVVQIKNKPPTILEYHWSSDTISPESIKTTIYNAFENWEQPTKENIIELLREEYPDDKIIKSGPRIEKLLRTLTFEIRFRGEVYEEYRKLGVDINRHKATVMRHFATLFPKNLSNKIYNVLKQYEQKGGGGQ